MNRLIVKPSNLENLEPNVYINDNVQGFYNKYAKRNEMVTILPGSIISGKQKRDSWMKKNILELENKGYITKITKGYKVLKPICGSPSGTAAIIRGVEGPNKPNGYEIWKLYSSGKSILKAGEKPD